MVSASISVERKVIDKETRLDQIQNADGAGRSFCGAWLSD